MATEPILKSIEDTDCYYDHMCMVVKQLKPALVRERYINRDPKFHFQDGFHSAFREQVEMMADLRMTQAEFEFKKKAQPWLTHDYLLWKRDSFRYRPEYVKSSVKDGKLDLMIEGPEDEVCHYETPLLSIISRLRGTTMINNERIKFDPDWMDWLRRDYDQMYNGGVNWIDFGARRRADYTTEAFACKLGKQYEWTKNSKSGCRGTANTHFAMENNLKLFGTFPHKYVQYCMALEGPRNCNYWAMKYWSDAYKGSLGVALTDTVTSDVFWRDIDPFFAKAFDGFRQDSGDPFERGEQGIANYERLGIDPSTKVGVFSDSLDPSKACMIAKRFNGRLLHTCGIGTRLTHNVGAHLPPMNHVIKAVEFNFGDRWIGVCKLSDVIGKAVGDPADIACTKHECGIERLAA